MYSELKFVQGSVAKKDLVPALTHFAIENGTVRGYNGMLALCSPIALDIECKPQAEPLIKAISNCNEVIQITLTPTGKLSLKSGKFKAMINCLPGDTPHVMPEGEEIELDGKSLISAMKTIIPFVGDDASRPWSNGILFANDSAYATNNVVMIEYWTGVTVSRPINIPRAAIKELIRIGEAPTHAQLGATSMTFHYEGGKWLRTQLLETDWPDFKRILDKEGVAQEKMNYAIFDGLKVVKPFVDKFGRVIFSQGKLSTHDEDSEGASYELEDFPFEGVYNIEMLNLLDGVAHTIDFAAYPAPCIFYGDRLRGAIIGMRI